MALVCYFIPGFGLFSILGHWQLEQIPYSQDLNGRFQNKTVDLYQSEPVEWTDLSRYNYTDNSGPHYSEYTYYTLTDYFLGFWILLSIHVLMNLLVKIACSPDFKKTFTSSPLANLVHCLENTNVPTVFKDWEEDGGSVEEHKRRHRKVVTEMVIIMIIRTLIHGVMLVPLLYTGRLQQINMIYFNL